MADFDTISPAHEFHFTEQDFEQVRKLIYQHAGISLNDSKRQMVYSRLARRLRATGNRSFTDYLATLPTNEVEWEHFINALTTNLTSFFREPHHFSALAEHLQKLGNKRQISIWCCAASSGEEPYSIAMTAVNAFGTFDPPVKIIASDLDTHVLEKAEAGVYAEERMTKVSAATTKRFFLKGTGAQAGFVKVRPELKAMMVFRQINLLQSAWLLRGPFDAIFCRNVMIYFNKDTQRQILERFVPLLEPEGLLFVGHSEHFYQATDIFKLCGRTTYRLTAEAKRRYG